MNRKGVVQLAINKAQTNLKNKKIATVFAVDQMSASFMDGTDPVETDQIYSKTTARVDRTNDQRGATWCFPDQNHAVSGRQTFLQSTFCDHKPEG